MENICDHKSAHCIVCNTCKQIICTECAINKTTGHTTHDIITFNQIINRYKESVDQNKLDFKKAVQIYESELKKYKEELDKLSSSKTQISNVCCNLHDVQCISFCEVCSKYLCTYCIINNQHDNHKIELLNCDGNSDLVLIIKQKISQCNHNICEIKTRYDTSNKILSDADIVYNYVSSLTDNNIVSTSTYIENNSIEIEKEESNNINLNNLKKTVLQHKLKHAQLKNDVSFWENKCNEIEQFDISLFDIKDEILQYFKACEETFEMLKQKCIDCIKNKKLLYIEIVGEINISQCGTEYRYRSPYYASWFGQTNYILSDYFKGSTIYEWFKHNPSKANAVNLIKHILNIKYDVNMYIKDQIFNVVNSNHQIKDQVELSNDINDNRIRIFNLYDYNSISAVKCYNVLVVKSDFSLDTYDNYPSFQTTKPVPTYNTEDSYHKLKFYQLSYRLNKLQEKCDYDTKKLQFLKEKYDTYLKKSLDCYSYLSLPNCMLNTNYICVATFNKLKKKVIKAVESNENIKIDIKYDNDNNFKKLSTIYYFRSLFILKSNHVPKITYGQNNSRIATIEFNLKIKNKK